MTKTIMEDALTQYIYDYLTTKISAINTIDPTLPIAWITVYKELPYNFPNTNTWNSFLSIEAERTLLQYNQEWYTGTFEFSIYLHQVATLWYSTAWTNTNSVFVKERAKQIISGRASEVCTGDPYCVLSLMLCMVTENGKCRTPSVRAIYPNTGCVIVNNMQVTGIDWNMSERWLEEQYYISRIQFNATFTLKTLCFS